jgi:GTP diphosphokinase / guanosine-3',5'-bis(diphosphate) 3'-diphosphatase
MINAKLVFKAIQVAVEAHDGQMDKNNIPYIFHPLRVMLRAETPEEQIVGVLHDVLEDTHLTEQDLLEEFPSEIVEAVKSVTRPKRVKGLDNETYKQFIQRAKQNRIGRKVKIHDLQDNLSRPKIPGELEDRSAKRNWKYNKSLQELKFEEHY